MLWIKAFHIVFMVTWFGGLFYLPRLFVYHAMSEDTISQERFKLMEHKLFFAIMTPGALLTMLFGAWLWLGYGFAGGWLNAKLALVAVLVAYHVLLWKLMVDFKRGRNRHGHVYYRWLNEIPIMLLITIVVLVVVKPF